MKTKIIYVLIALSSSLAQAADPNIYREGNKVLVKPEACLQYQGKITDTDKRYFMCEGGKYDGYITGGPAENVATVSLEQRAIALVQAQYLGEQEHSYYTAAAPIQDGSTVVVIVSRHAAGGPCTVNVQFRRSGSVLIPLAKCKPGS